MSRQVGVAHLTLLSLTPPEVIEAAAAAGFDFVGLRVKAVTAAERAFPMGVGSPMLRETLARMQATGVAVRDIEFLPLTGETTRDDWLPALASGAALGASAITVTGADAERSRLLGTLALLVNDAREHGIRPLLEPISYQPVSRVADAAGVARATGAALMLDPLHIARGGSPLNDVRALEPDLVPVVQLCDAPADAPDGGVPALQHEARVQRLLPGEGELPLAELLCAVPADTPVSVEIPHAALAATLSPTEYAVRAAQATRALVDAVDAERLTAPRSTEGEK